jgi:hypothetical protein
VNDEGIVAAPDLPLWASFGITRHEVLRLGETGGMMPVAESKDKIEFLKRRILR